MRKTEGHKIYKKVKRATFTAHLNRFVKVGEHAGADYTLFMMRPPVSTTTMKIGPADHFTGLCTYHIIRDAKMQVGFLFRSKSEFTRITPVSLIVTVGADTSDFKEVVLPPKIGILVFTSMNASVVVVPADGVELPYVITGD